MEESKFKLGQQCMWFQEEEFFIGLISSITLSGLGYLYEIKPNFIMVPAMGAEPRRGIKQSDLYLADINSLNLMYDKKIKNATEQAQESRDYLSSLLFLGGRLTARKEGVVLKSCTSSDW